MRNEFLKTLWLLRFEKIKKTEEEAAWNYQRILDQCLAEFGFGDEAVGLLGQLVRDERMHAALGEELIKICRWNHPEYECFLP